jgi:putative chitinase
MPELSASQLAKIMPACSQPDVWVQALNSAMARFDIVDNQRMAAFLAQMAHESSQLTRLKENLNYTANRLMQVWPNRFPTLDKAQPYERNPEKLANYVYAKRLGNGDESSGDGWRYRGRGIIQLTGRGNYRAAGEGIGLPLENQPELLEQPDAAALSAAWFWKSHGLNELADNQNDDNDMEDFITITKRINGGTVGLKERIAFWQRSKEVLSA